MSQIQIQDDWDQGGMESHEAPQQFVEEENFDGGNYNQDHQNDDLQLQDGEGNDDILDLDGSGDRAQNDDGRSKLLMKFCPHDQSMLYPKEHKRTRTLRYACRLCKYSEEATNPLIYQNILKKEVGNVLHTVPGAISDDPTLPRSQNASCMNCGHHEAVFFQSDTGQSDSLALIFVCCNCEHKWVA
mmetsp:Transcript_1612/g.2292  ORF Transcript_1612/g.2292 Transcript_1612/m.2292 type:complete len:186 (-) Transcript_1612:349-906(-)